MNTGPIILEEEEWRPLQDYPGYEVSSCGRIRSRVNHKAKRLGAPVVIGDTYMSHGYYVVGLKKQDGTRKAERVHRLVATAFCQRLPGQWLVRHLNDVRTDNRAVNLAWGCDADNKEDAMRNGKIKCGEDHHSAFITDEQVREIYLSDETTYKAAGRYGVSPSYISNIRTRRVRQDATEGLGRAPGAVGMGGFSRGRGRTITREQAIEIYTSPLPHSVLARKMGVSMTHVLRIRQGKKWGSVTRDLPQPKYGRSVAGIRVDADGKLSGRSITAEQAAEIYTSRDRARDIAKRFGITESLVSSIRKGCAWRHVTYDLTQPVRDNYRKHVKT